MRIVEYGNKRGLKYIYPGNLPGQVGEWENTRCHHCSATVIERFGISRHQAAESKCGRPVSRLRNPIPGIWGQCSGHGDGRVRRVSLR